MQTTEVYGDGTKLTGLKHKDRTNDSMHDIALAGISFKSVYYQTVAGRYC